MLFLLISLVTYFTFLILKGRKALIILDKDKYNIKKKKKDIINKQNFLTPELLGVLLIIVAFFFNSKITYICTIIFYMFLSLLEIKNMNNKFKFNKQNIKIIIITSVIYLIIFAIMSIDYYNYVKGMITYDRTNFYYPIIFIIGYILYFIIYLIANLTIKIGNKKKQKNHKLK